jgi:hypothetical protein
MQGRETPPELRGIIPNSFDHIFEVGPRQGRVRGVKAGGAARLGRASCEPSQPPTQSRVDIVCVAVCVCVCVCVRVCAWVPVPQAVKISTHKEFLIRCAYLEIYNEEVCV